MGLNNLNAMPFGGGKRVCPGIGQEKIFSIFLSKNPKKKKKKKKKLMYRIIYM
jgi:hypothetical protein